MSETMSSGSVTRKVLLIKAHVASYTKQDGTFVAAHEDKRQAAQHPFHEHRQAMEAKYGKDRMFSDMTDDELDKHERLEKEFHADQSKSSSPTAAPAVDRTVPANYAWVTEEQIDAAIQILDAVSNAKTKAIGLRVIPDDHQLKVGDTLPPSFKWNNGENTGKPLSGTSTAAIKTKDLHGVLDALHNLSALGRAGKNGFYSGKRIALIVGKSGKKGEDHGEKVISDAVIRGLWEKKSDFMSPVVPSATLAKAHVKGYSRKDGTYVAPHERRGDAAAPQAVPHPRIGEKGEEVMIHRPPHASMPSTWHHPDAVATFVPDGDVPASLNGVPVRKWRDHPQTNEGWEYSDGIMDDLDEPPFHLPAGKKAAAGVVIEESDGRVWVIAPTNAFGGYEHTWPKGSLEPDMSLQGTALKEAFEESGLKVRITGFIGDFHRTTSVARMYRAERVGGDPTQAGWETQSVKLVPKEKLYAFLNMDTDHGIAEAIGAGDAPEKQKKEGGKLF
jgi:ADP-ribose pyrophosphatase YjhB (NUDIX family)